MVALLVVFLEYKIAEKCKTSCYRKELHQKNRLQVLKRFFDEIISARCHTDAGNRKVSMQSKISSKVAASSSFRRSAPHEQQQEVRGQKYKIKKVLKSEVPKI
jgi:hypothetical protein